MEAQAVRRNFVRIILIAVAFGAFSGYLSGWCMDGKGYWDPAEELAEPSTSQRNDEIGGMDRCPS
jgi:hypothetical protein